MHIALPEGPGCIYSGILVFVRYTGSSSRIPCVVKYLSHGVVPSGTGAYPVIQAQLSFSLRQKVALSCKMELVRYLEYRTPPSL